MDSVSSFAGLRAPAPTASTSSAGSSPPPSPMKKMATRGFGDKPPGLRKNSTVLGSFARKASVFARPGARPPIGGPGGPDRPKRSASVLAFSRPGPGRLRYVEETAFTHFQKPSYSNHRLLARARRFPDPQRLSRAVDRSVDRSVERSVVLVVVRLPPPLPM